MRIPACMLLIKGMEPDTYGRLADGNLFSLDPQAPWTLQKKIFGTKPLAEKITIRQSGRLCPALNSHGMAIVLCLLLMTTLCLIGGAALSVSELNRKIVGNGTRQVQAFYAAEAGRQSALAHLQANPMWRGNKSKPPSFYKTFGIKGIQGTFHVVLSDCTADENGIFNALLPAGCIMMKSTGTWRDASQTVFSMVRLSPMENSAATFPQVALISSGSAGGPLTVLDDLGSENSLMIQTGIALPEANEEGLTAMAERAFPALDNDSWDEALSGIDSFWQDSPVNTKPRILYVQGDLAISGHRKLYGIVFVEGKHITLEDESEVRGVLYAPFATSVKIQNAGAPGRLAVAGMVATGRGGLEITGNALSIQLYPDYVDAFNTAAGSKVNIDLVPGSWTTF